MVEVALDQSGPPGERKVALIDKNRDLYLSPVRRLGREPCVCKIGEVAGSPAVTVTVAFVGSLSHHRLL